MPHGILTDLTKCIGCEACVAACKEINNLPVTPKSPKGLTDETWTCIEKRGGVNIRRQCMHCLEPTCASVCPVAALEKTPEGAVIYHEDRCIGCRYCIMACPFEIPKYEWFETKPRVRKCILCYDQRIKEGKEPACTSVCPTGATLFGERDDLLIQAKGRIKSDPKRYVNHVYGEHEAGGTSVLYISAAPFQDLGFRLVADDDTPYPKLTWNILSQIPNIVSVGGVMMIGVWWVINRRMKIEREEKGGD